MVVQSDTYYIPEAATILAARRDDLAVRGLRERCIKETVTHRSRAACIAHPAYKARLLSYAGEVAISYAISCSSSTSDDSAIPTGITSVTVFVYVLGHRRKLHSDLTKPPRMTYPSTKHTHTRNETRRWHCSNSLTQTMNLGN